jgi:hypothetical protein
MPRVTIAVLLALAVTTPGAAQSPPEARHQSIGAAAHWALPYPPASASSCARSSIRTAAPAIRPLESESPSSGSTHAGPH